MPRLFLLIVLLASSALAVVIPNAQQAEPTPIVLWHGMGDTCCLPQSMGRIKQLLQEQIPGVFVLSLRIGDSEAADQQNGFLMDVNEQIAYACNVIGRTSQLANGYNSIGFSQGGQFLRAVAQRCPSPGMKNLISIGGQHQGVDGMPHCAGNNFLCNILRKLLDEGAYVSYVQEHLVQAQYWHDPLQEQEYRKVSKFLAEINNENIVNKTYVENLQKLSNFVMVKFLNDTMVVPRASEWFGFYKPGMTNQTESLQNSRIYTEERLGLKQMDADGKLHFLSTLGQHLQFTEQWFIINIVNVFLK